MNEFPTKDTETAQPSERPLISIVLPLFNEQGGLSLFLDSLDRALADVSVAVERIVIDDGSRDGTWGVVEEMLADGRIEKALRFSRNFGKEAAIRAGLEHASGDAVICMDSDLQHPPDLIPEMIKKWQSSGVWIVEAVKKSRGKEGMFYAVSARLFYFLMGNLAEFSIENATDFKLLDRRAVDVLVALPERNLFFRGLAAWTGLPREQIEFNVPERAAGTTSWSFKRLAALFVSGVVSFSSAPLQVVTAGGVLFFVLAILLGLQTFWNYLTGTAVSGFTTVILLQLIVGSGVMLGVGLMGLYVASIYNEMKGRPRFILLELKERSKERLS